MRQCKRCGKEVGKGKSYCPECKPSRYIKKEIKRIDYKKSVYKAQTKTATHPMVEELISLGRIDFLKACGYIKEIDLTKPIALCEGKDYYSNKALRKCNRCGAWIRVGSLKQMCGDCRREYGKEKLIAYVKTPKGKEYAAMAMAVRNHRAKHQTLKGINKEEIKAIYKEAKRLTQETGIVHHVDHIVPLKGKDVRGLHVPWNMQILTASENCRKGNRL